jgi:hypothetical protein
VLYGDDGLKITRNRISPEQVEKLNELQSSKKLKQLIHEFQAKNGVQAAVGQENPFDGWWQQITRGSLLGFGVGGPALGTGTADIDSYINIDTSTAPFITIRTLCGTPALPRKCTNVDLHPKIILNLYYQASATALVNILDLNGPLFNPVNGQSFWSLELQPDGKTLVASFDSRPEFIGYKATSYLFRKVDGPQQPVRPFNDTDSAFPDVTNPVAIAQYIYNSLTLNSHDPQNINLHDGDYRSFYQREEIFRKLLNEGFTFRTPIRRVRVSQPGEHFVAEFGNTTEDVVTDIFTDGFSFATAGSTVEICGFKGKWSKLNGKYINGVAVTEEGAVPNPSSEHVDVFSTNKPCKKGTFCNVFNHFLLDFDSSNKKQFPRDNQGWATDIEGEPIVKVTHRITPDMEYPAFRAAIEAMFYLMYQVSQHTGFNAYFRPKSIFLIDTREKLKDVVAKNKFWGSRKNPGDNLVRTRTNQSVPSGFFNNAVFNGRSVVTYNDPFGLTQQAGSKYDYNIVLANYIVKQKNLYFAIAGTPDLTPVAPNGQPIQFDPTTIGYKPVVPGAQRAEFVGQLGDIIVVNGRPQPQNPDPEHFTLLGENPFDDVAQSNDYYIGLIDPELTNGKKVGYLRWVDVVAVDPQEFITTATFPPAHVAPPPGNVKYGREALSQVYSQYTRFFNDENCDAIIIDIRTNEGGLLEPAFTLAEFVGDDRRSAISQFWTDKDNGNSPLVELADPNQFSTFNNLQALNNEAFIRFYVQQNEQNYPGSVFRGSQQNPKKIIILTDTAAASAGDILPHFFLGENLDGNLGSFTTGKIIGDIDGRFKGASSNRSPVPVAKDSNRLYGKNGKPFPPIRFRVDFAVGEINNGLTNIFFNQQSDLVAPSEAPSLQGTAGHDPLPNDWENNVWPALGLIKAPKGLFDSRIPKDKPQSNKRKTWRDPWLEQAILSAIED